jgi:cyanate lyase
MTKTEVLQLISREQFNQAANTKKLNGLQEVYTAAAMMNDRTRCNEIAEHLHNVLDLQLDSIRHMSYLQSAYIDAAP